MSNVLGYACRGRSPWLALGLMVALALATVPVIGVEAIAFTPYLGCSPPSSCPPAVEVGHRALGGRCRCCRWSAPTGSRPASSSWSGRSCSAACCSGSSASASTRARGAGRARRWSPSASGSRATCTTCSGHSLTALSIKAELAARLIDVDPARAKAELESIQETARQALAEVRATVGGLRAANLEAELAARPAVLADAGIPRPSSAPSPTPTRGTGPCWPGCCASP